MSVNTLSETLLSEANLVLIMISLKVVTHLRAPVVVATAAHLDWFWISSLHSIIGNQSVSINSANSKLHNGSSLRLDVEENIHPALISCFVVCDVLKARLYNLTGLSAPPLYDFELLAISERCSFEQAYATK